MVAILGEQEILPSFIIGVHSFKNIKYADDALDGRHRKKSTGNSRQGSKERREKKKCTNHQL